MLDFPNFLFPSENPQNGSGVPAMREHVCVRVVWLWVSMCNHQQTSTQTSQPPGWESWEPGIKSSHNFGMNTRKNIDILLEIQAGVLIFIF